ncbi:thermonuclease family protein [Nocardioides currus]|uniref:thermonuclease family protein n=1 Tax=Nocardioides currus TaxID=2133958 RepID=UPI001401C7B2|nr:thermonuclease family protein [Nocardioides currus]
MSLFAGSTPGAGARAVAGASGSTVRVADGDTIVAVVGGVEERVRFLNIDTPEVGRCLAGAATKFTSSRLPEGGAIELGYDRDLRDPYERLLAMVRPAGGTWLSVDLAAEGLGFPLTVAPNTAYKSAVETASSTARRRGVGLFDPTLPCTPIARAETARGFVGRAQSMPAGTQAQFHAVNGVLDRAGKRLELLVPMQYGIVTPSFRAWLMALKRPVLASIKTVRASKAQQWKNAQKAASESSSNGDNTSSGGWWPPGVPRNYTGPRCYEPGGVIWYPC